MTKKVKLIVFRHGETAWNATKRFQGSMDIELNENGLFQASELSERLTSQGIQHIISSPQKRAVQTATAVAKKINCEISLWPELREIHMGFAEGLTHDEVRVHLGSVLWKKYKSQTKEAMDFCFEGGESKIKVLERTLACLEKFISITPHQVVAVSTHGAVLRYLLNHTHNYLGDAFAIENCCAFEFLYEVEGKKLLFIKRI